MIMIAEMYRRNSKASRCLPGSLMTFIDDLGRLTEARSGVVTYWPQIEQALTLEGINTRSGDGYRYRGRGFIQLTGRYNYRVYGQRLHLDLEKNPDQALDPVIAARVLASYFKHRPGLVEACEHENWREVRRPVNGQYNGWERFHALVLPLALAAKVAAAADATAVRPAN